MEEPYLLPKFEIAVDDSLGFTVKVYGCFLSKYHLIYLDFRRTVRNVTTVEPVYNGHPRDLRNWPLNTGSLKILTGRGLMSILMAYHTKTIHARKQ